MLSSSCETCVHLRVWRHYGRTNTPKLQSPLKCQALAADVVVSSVVRGVLLLLFVRFGRRRRSTCHVMFSSRCVRLRAYGGTTWHRGVRSAAGLPDRVTPNAAPHHYRRCRSGIGGGDCFVVIISYPPRTAHTSEPDWHHTSTRRQPALCPPHRHSSDQYATTRHVVPAPLRHPIPTVRHGVSAVWLSFVLSVCMCVRVRCVRRGGAASEQRLAVCPFGTPPGGATRRPAPQHHRRACRSVGRSPVNQKGRIFSGTPPYYIIFIYYI